MSILINLTVDPKKIKKKSIIKIKYCCGKIDN